MTKGSLLVPGFMLQEAPTVYVTSLPGQWLLKHSTPSWRIKDPEKGFQRVVREERAQQIAAAVLNQHRTFPNAIILATDRALFTQSEAKLSIPEASRFLVVDGQHRLWAQKFSDFRADYGCFVHTGLSEVEMAKLFLEINDNQKRVPSSLRWDLVRLVRPEDDPYAVKATELLFELATTKRSPLYQRVDLTGEQREITLKQGSLAPELKTLVSRKAGPFRDLDFDAIHEILTRFFAAVRSLDPEGWRSARSPLYNNRVIRALLRNLPVIVTGIGKHPSAISTGELTAWLRKIDVEELAPDRIRALQGSAGIAQIQAVIKAQLGI